MEAKKAIWSIEKEREREREIELGEDCRGAFVARKTLLCLLGGFGKKTSTFEPSP